MSAVLSEQPVFLPESWGNEALSDVVDYFKGRKPTALTEFATDGCQPYLTADYLRSGKASQFATSSSLPSCVLCAPNDPILIWDGSNAGDCFTGAAGALASTMVRLLPNTGRLRNDFLFFFLKSQFRFLNRNTTGSTIPHVNRNVFVNLQLPLPSLDEQRRIAAVLGVVQQAIEQQECLLALTAELKKTLLHQLFTQGLRGEPQKQTEIGLVPESWDVVKMGSLVNFQTGKLNSNAATPEGEFPFFTCSQETFWIDHYAFDTEALLLSGNNAQGIYSVKHFKGKFNAYQRTYVITLRDENTLPYTFLHQVLSRNLERLRTLSIGTSTKYLTMGVLQNLPIAKPSYEEAKDVGDRLQMVEKKFSLHERKHAALTDLFRTLLHQLMTAQIRVHDLDLPDLD